MQAGSDIRVDSSMSGIFATVDLYIDVNQDINEWTLLVAEESGLIRQFALVGSEFEQIRAWQLPDGEAPVTLTKGQF